MNEPQIAAPDALAELQHDLAGNSMGAVMQRERHEQRERQQRTALVDHGAARYRKIVLCQPDVTDVEFRVLCIMLGAIYMVRRRKIRTVWAAIARLQAKGYLRRHRGKGWQLRLPRGVIGADAWSGPENWSNRDPDYKRRLA